jgi:hypothetical protein
MPDPIYIKMRVTEEERDLLDRECDRLKTDRSTLMHDLVFTGEKRRISKPTGREPINRAIAKVTRDYDVPRHQIEPLVSAVINVIAD